MMVSGYCRTSKRIQARWGRGRGSMHGTKGFQEGKLSSRKSPVRVYIQGLVRFTSLVFGKSWKPCMVPQPREILWRYTGDQQPDGPEPSCSGQDFWSSSARKRDCVQEVADCWVWASSEIEAFHFGGRQEFVRQGTHWEVKQQDVVGSGLSLPNVMTL